MEGAAHGDDLVGAAATALAPLAGQLDGALVGLGAAVAEEHVAQPAGLGDQRGQAGHRLAVEGRAAVDEARRLRFQRAAHRGMAVAQAVHRPALDEIEIVLAVLIAQPRSAALDEHYGGTARDLHHGAEWIGRCGRGSLERHAGHRFLLG